MHSIPTTVTLQALEMTLKCGIIALNSYHGQFPGFTIMCVHLANVSSRALELCENSLEVRIPAAISNNAPPSLRIIRFTSDTRAKGQRAK